MVENDLSALVNRLKRGGRLTSDELALIKLRLATPEEGELSQLSRILSLGAPPTRENIQLLEPWLKLTTTDWGLHGIIVSLCHDWKLTKDYLQPLLEIARLENWETHETAILWALSALGEYLNSNDDLYVLGHLFGQIEKVSTAINQSSTTSLCQYRNALWYPLDRWQRGVEAIDPRMPFDASSTSFIEAKNRYRDLLQ